MISGSVKLSNSNKFAASNNELEMLLCLVWKMLCVNIRETMEPRRGHGEKKNKKNNDGIFISELVGWVHDSLCGESEWEMYSDSEAAEVVMKLLILDVSLIWHT